MTVTLPAPYGKADWTDYVDYWRDNDAEWLQERAILRFADIGTRNSTLSSATAGQTTYVANPDRLEFKSATNQWIGVLGAQNIKIGPVNATLISGSPDGNESVTISHTASTGSQGLVIGKDLTATSTTTTDLNGVFKVINTGAPAYATFKTGAATVKFTTDGTGLVMDTGITSIPSISTGALTVTGATTAASGAFSGALSGNTVSSTTTVTAGTAVNAATGTIGGVSLPGAGGVTATYYQSDHARFLGTSAGAKIAQWSGTALGASSFEVRSTSIHVVSTGDFTVEGQTKIFESKGLIYYNGAGFGTPGSILGYGGPVVYSTTALTAANYPPGTIWVS